MALHSFSSSQHPASPSPWGVAAKAIAVMVLILASVWLIHPSSEEMAAHNAKRATLGLSAF